MRNYFLSRCCVLCLSILLTSCGFHLQGEVQLAPPLHRLYLQTADPYGYLARNLQEYLKLSNVQLVSTKEEAQTVLAILQDSNGQQLLSVSGTQQTRQYHLTVTLVFEITDANGRVIVPAQTLTETRTITVQSNQILGSSNEANLYYQQMRRSLAYALMNRIASKEISAMIDAAYPSRPKIRSSKP